MDKMWPACQVVSERTGQEMVGMSAHVRCSLSPRCRGWMVLNTVEKSKKVILTMLPMGPLEQIDDGITLPHMRLVGKLQRVNPRILWPQVG